jgi:hypothetical protein
MTQLLRYVPPRYVETHAGDDRWKDWMKVRDRWRGEAFLVGPCSRECQLDVLKCLNLGERAMETSTADKRPA